jgi:alanine dehydrogenase
VLGTYAAMSFLDAGTKVNVLDLNRDRLENIYTLSNGRIVTAMATEENIEKFGKFAEVLVSSVLISGETSPLLVTRKILKEMRRGSAVIDFSIDQGGAIDVTRKKGPQADYYVEDDLVFYAVPNVPSQVPRSSSHALTHAVLPYLKTILQKGCLEAIKSEKILKNAVYLYQGKCMSNHLVGRCNVESW